MCSAIEQWSSLVAQYREVDNVVVRGLVSGTSVSLLLISYFLEMETDARRL